MTTILLLEDDEMMSSLLRTMLEDAGYQVLSAASVANGLRILAESGEHIRAALLDFWLGGRSVLPVIDHICGNYPDLPMVMISGGSTGMSLETTKAVGEASGRVHFLPKPLSRAELLKLLGRLI